MKTWCAFFALFLPLQAFCEAYQWKDDKGRTKFSDSPPADRPYKTLNIAPTAVPPHRLFWRIGTDNLEQQDPWPMCSTMKVNQIWHRKHPNYFPGHEFGFTELIRAKCGNWKAELDKLDQELTGR